MQQRTGSVYLDAPARPSRAPVPTSRERLRTRAGGACVGLGVAALTIAMLIIGFRTLALGPAAAQNAFDTTIDEPLARAELEREVAVGIEQQLVGEELTAIAAAYGLDIGQEADRVAASVVADPTVQDELRNLAEDIHSQILVERDPTNLDLGPVTTAAVAVIATESPRLATVLPEDASLWSIDPDSLPDLTGTVALMNRVLLLVFLPILLIPAGVVVHPHRHRVAGAVGRWALVFGLTGALAAVGLPYAAGSLSGFTSMEIAVRSASLKLLAPSVVIGVFGMGLVSLAAFLHHRETRRVSEEGAAAALGYDEPPLWSQPSGASIDLPTRGLVDVNHPLTNI